MIDSLTVVAIEPRSESPDARLLGEPVSFGSSGDWYGLFSLGSKIQFLVCLI